MLDNDPKFNWKCNKCSKKISVAFEFRLCDECLDEVIDKKKASGNNNLTDEEFSEYFLSPKNEQN